MNNQNRTFNFRDDGTIFDAMRLYQNLSNEFNPFFDELTELFDFTTPRRQWKDEHRAAMKGRPVFSYNVIRTILNVIFGAEEANTEIGKPKPRTGGDAQLTNVVWQVLSYYLYHGGFLRAQKKVFETKTIARLGIHHLGWKYNGSSDDLGSLFCEANDPREFMWEANYNDPLWEDASFIMRKHEMSLEELIETFALNDEEMRSAMIAEAKTFMMADPERGKWISRKLKALFSAVFETATGFSSRNDSTFNNYLQWWNPRSNKFDVLELHEKRSELKLLVNDPGENRQIDITETYRGDYKQLEGKDPDGYNYDPEIINSIKDRYGLNGDAKSEVMKRRFVTAVVPAFNMKVNEQPYPFESKYYVYIPEYCYDYHADPMKLQSVLDDLKDPQQELNKSRSLILELIGKYANKKVIIDENAIGQGLEDDWKAGNNSLFARVRSGYIGMLKPLDMPTISPELLRQPAEAQQLMAAISNTLQNEISGQSNEGVKSGKHFQLRETSQTKSLTKLFKNRSYSLRAVTELSLQFIQHYVQGQTVIRITTDIPGAKEEKELVLNQSIYSMVNGEIVEKVLNDLDAFEYDIEVVSEPYSQSAQQERYEKLGDIFNATISIGTETAIQKAEAMLPIIVKNHGAMVADEILSLPAWQEKEATPEQAQQQAQMQELIQSIQIIMAKLGIEEKQAEIKGKKLDNIQKAKQIKQMKTDNVFRLLDMKSRNNNGKQKQRAA